MIANAEGVALYIALAVVLAVLLYALVATRERARWHAGGRTKTEFADLWKALADEHEKVAGHRFRDGTAEPETCDVCAVLAGDR